MRRILALAAIGGFILLIGGVWLLQNLFEPLPSDASLGARYREHRDELDALVATALADTQLVGAGHDWMLMRFDVFVHDTPQFDRMLMDNEVRATGRSEYRRLLDRAGVRSFSRSRDGNAVWFVVGSGLDARKGIVYSEKPLAPMNSSLDGLERPRDGYVREGYLPLAPHWFVFLTSRD